MEVAATMVKCSRWGTALEWITHSVTVFGDGEPNELERGLFAAVDGGSCCSEIATCQYQVE